MPARTTRQEARQRAIDTFMGALDRIIPADESMPLKGSTFLDWENQVAQTEVRGAEGAFPKNCSITQMLVRR